MAADKKVDSEEEEKHLEKKRQRIANFRKNHPRGTCLLARDNPHNRKLFPDGPFGKRQPLADASTKIQSVTDVTV